LKLLNSNDVNYLVVGGYAVGYYGYIRATGYIDIWVGISDSNADGLVRVLKLFGFSEPEISPDLFLAENQIIRMGLPPLRIEILTSISGVTFDVCYAKRTIASIDEVEVNLISLKDLKLNKAASGRHKDLADLENLI
jgi:hypothetical protein